LVALDADDDGPYEPLLIQSIPGYPAESDNLKISYDEAILQLYSDSGGNSLIHSGDPVMPGSLVFAQGVDVGTTLVSLFMGDSQAADQIRVTIIEPVVEMPGNVSVDERELLAAVIFGDETNQTVLSALEGKPVTFSILHNGAQTGTVSGNISGGAAAAVIPISTVPGDTYQVVADVLGARYESDRITIVPGEPATITYELLKPTYVSDGTDRIAVTATIRDQFGNLVADGTSVDWQLAGIGGYFDAGANSLQFETTGGVAQATIVAPEIGGQQTITIRSGSATTSATINVSQVTASLAGPAVLNLAAQESGVVILTTSAADGTPVVWTISNGDVHVVASVVAGGTSSIPLQAAGQFARVGQTVVTATVGSTLTYTTVQFTTTAPLSLQLERFVISGDVTVDGVEVLNHPDAQPLPFAPPVVPNETVNVPFYGNSMVMIRGNPSAIYELDLPDATSQALAMLNALGPSNRITLDQNGLGVFQLGSRGAMGGDLSSPEFANVVIRARSVDPFTLEIDPLGDTSVVTAKYVQHGLWTRTWDATQSFIGGDPQTGVGVAANIAGGMLIVGDVGSLAKNGWRAAGFSEKEPNYAEAGTAGLGLLTEVALGAGELADAPISGVKSLLAALGDLPAAKILPLLYKRALANAADLGQFVRFIGRISNDAALQVLKQVLTTEDVVQAAIRASDDFGDNFFATLRHVSADPNLGGIPAAQHVAKLLADVPGNARQFFLNLGADDLKTAMEHVGVVLNAGKLDASMVQKLLTHDALFTASYTRMRFLEDLRIVSEAEGLQSWAKQLFSTFPNAVPGRLYELQAAATIMRNGGGNSMQWIAKVARNPDGSFLTDFDFIIDSVYYQAKRGWGAESVSTTAAWIAKAKADGAQTIKYVTPGGPSAVPQAVRNYLQSNKNPMNTPIDILDVAIP
jgi:hypothetical protein